MAEQRPRGRQKDVSGPGKTVKKRGTGLHTGPVGSAGGYGGRPAGGTGSRPGAGGQPLGKGMSRRPQWGGIGRGTGSRAGRGGSPGVMLLLLLLVLLLGGGGGLGALFGNLSGQVPGGGQTGQGGPVSQGQAGGPGGTSQGQTGQAAQGSQSGGLGGLSGGIDLTALFGGLGGGSVSTGWSGEDNRGRLDTSVAAEARPKRTALLGEGRDTATIMVYMCGTDLESRSGMGTADLQEMLAADLGDHINLLVYTGGCSGWKNDQVSHGDNQIWQVADGELRCREADLGSVSMTDPATLTGYIRWCAKNYPASRYELIFWDHGGGSVSGYGYDQKFPSSGSMSLAQINRALKDAGVTFDFIGFDACLMATAETAVMLAQYGDYMIASEETEPGVGWYYTDWLTAFGKDPSMPTIQIGKRIIDDFVDVCAKRCPGQLTTLSIVDLAEFEGTVPERLTAFSESASHLLEEQQYKTLSDARNGAREFARSSKIDQVDLVHLSQNLGTEEGEGLAKALLGAVKYNRTSSNMTNAYGVSIYFPYQKVSTVDKAVASYREIGMDESYARCIKQFASLEASGQAVSGGTGSPLEALLGSLVGGYSGSTGNGSIGSGSTGNGSIGSGGTGNGSSGSGNTGSGNAGSGGAGNGDAGTGAAGNGTGSAQSGAEMIGQLLESFLGGDFGSIAGLGSGNTGFLADRALDQEAMVRYLEENRFDGDALLWTKGQDGGPVLALEEDQWRLVQDLELNVFYDDGEGFIDLGLDNVFDFDEEGRLLGRYDGTWLAIDGQPVAYYHTGTVDDGQSYTITGRVPVLHNGERAELLLVFDDAHPEGFVAGIRTVYAESETETVAKSITGLEKGDQIEFLCDYYRYDGTYQDSFYLGDPLTVGDGELVISNVPLEGGPVEATYRFTDIYNQQYWTPPMS